jgi:hypothetical protein
MKNKIQLLSVLFLITVFSDLSFSQCKVKTIVNGCKPNLKPFNYDSYAITDIEFTDKAQKIEVQFTAFANQKYKLVFCSSGFEEMVKVNIYDKSNRVKNRNKVYDNENGIDNLFWSFQPPKTGDYFIEYEVPAALDAKTKAGCIILIIGTQLTGE